MATSSKTILIVDDNPDDVDAVRRMIRRADGEMTIHAAATVEDAAQLMQLNEYSAIVADHYLLSETGTELLAHALTQQPTAKRILMTGMPRLEIIQGALARGKIHGFFRKDHEDEAIRVLADNLR